MSGGGRRVGYVEIAQHVGVPVGTVRAWVSRRRIPHLRLAARTVVFDVDEVDRWLEAHRVPEGGAR